MKRFMLKIMQTLLWNKIKKNIVTPPEVVHFEGRKCIGYKITTTLEGNKKKKDIPPFYHEIYDHDKLSKFRSGENQDMFCIYDFYENKTEFDYYVAVEKKEGIAEADGSTITLPAGNYIRVELLKRNHTAVSLIAVYLRKIWIELKNLKHGNSAPFMLYDERFHSNYKKYGCTDGNYPGYPVTFLFVPVQ